MQLCSLVHFINFHFCKTIFRIVFEYCFLNTSIQKFFKKKKKRRKSLLSGLFDLLWLFHDQIGVEFCSDKTLLFQLL